MAMSEKERLEVQITQNRNRQLVNQEKEKKQLFKKPNRSDKRGAYYLCHCLTFFRMLLVVNLGVVVETREPPCVE